MTSNPLLGVFLHMVGGLAAGSFYVPYRGVRKWVWETYWLAGGVFSWLIAPWVLAYAICPDLLAVLRDTWAESPNFVLVLVWRGTRWSLELPLSEPIVWCYLFGVMWGIGGLTFGLSMRYLGMSLGYAIALGYCAVFGTLMPPIFAGKFLEILTTQSGIVTLVGVAVCLGGIAVTGMAGMSKERELSEEQKKATIQEFSFLKGILVATFSGIMSAGMAYGLAAGEPIKEVAVNVYHTPDLFGKLPVLIVVLAGGFTSNFLWCLYLSLANRTWGNYVDTRTPLLRNYLLCALAGTTWYMQFFFYQMGEARIGQYKFSSWSLHMASIIIFSTLWGIGLREWKGSSRRTEKLLATGLAVLVASLAIIGYGNYLKPPE